MTDDLDIPAEFKRGDPKCTVPLPKHVVRDAIDPRLFRVQRPDGSLTDRLNFSRACQVARE